MPDSGSRKLVMRSTMVLFPWPEGPHDGDAFSLVELQHRVLDDPGLARPSAL